MARVFTDFVCPRYTRKDGRRDRIYDFIIECSFRQAPDWLSWLWSATVEAKKKKVLFAETRMGNTFAVRTGKCCAVSSLRILQGLTAAKVEGCSNATQRAYPPASLAQLARARDL